MNGDRRGFLRQLATLPLIGGGVTLIGQPTQAAVPVTRQLQERYVAWLAHEHAAALFELERPGVHHVEPFAWPAYRDRAPMFWFPDAPDIERDVWLTKPSSRAAVVLSAVGCDWKLPR